MRRITIILIFSLLFPALSFCELDSLNYHYLDAIYESIFNLQAQYPDIVKIDTIGYSQQDNRPIHAIKISNDVNTDYDRPVVAFFGQIHAEEVIGVELVLSLMDTLAISLRPQYRRYRAQLETYFVPTINPDGLTVCWGDTNYCHLGPDAPFRKNRRDNNENGIFDYILGPGEDIDGVDLNRNFPINWFAGDTLYQHRPETDERYDYYRGPAPGSESEIHAIMDFCREIQPLYSVTFHASRTGTFTGQSMYPWHWEPVNSTRTSPDFDIIEDIAEIIANLNNGVFVPSTGRNGKMHDWMYAEGGWVNYQVETGPPIDIQPVYERVLQEIATQLPVCYYLMDRARRLSDTSQHLKVIVTDESATPLVAEVLIPARNDGYLKPRLTDPIFGVHRRPLPTGSFIVVTRKWGYLPDTTTIAISPDLVTDHNVTLHPAPYHNVTIGVYNGADNSLLDAEVVIHKDHGIYKSDTLNLSALYETQWPEGYYEVETWVDGYIPRRFEFELTEDYDLFANLSQIESANTIFDDFESDPLPDFWSWDVDTSWGRSNCDVYHGLTALESYPRWQIPRNETLTLSYTQQIPNNVESLVFTGYRCYEFEPEADYCLVEVSYDDGNNWTELENINGFSRWHRFFYNLREGITGEHESLILRWTITTDQANVDRGLFMDDVALISANDNYYSAPEPELPGKFELHAPYPNPFNPSTNISFNVALDSHVLITVYDILGQEVTKLVNADYQTGKYNAVLNMNNYASGLYFIKMNADNYSNIKKIMLIK